MKIPIILVLLVPIVLPGLLGLGGCGGHVTPEGNATDGGAPGTEGGGASGHGQPVVSEPGSPGVTGPGEAFDASLPEDAVAVPLAPPDGGCEDDAGVTQPPPVPLAPNAQCSATTEALAAWTLGGSAPADYQTGFDTSMTCNGTPALHLSSSTADGGQFGEMGTETGVGAWAGQRVRLSGWVLASGVTGWVGLWMRVDTASQNGVEFDNMQCRAITGTTGWAQVQIVLDVPADASRVAYGVLLVDQGEVWLDGVELEVVDACVPTTGCP